MSWGRIAGFFCFDGKQPVVLPVTCPPVTGPSGADRECVCLLALYRMQRQTGKYVRTDDV